MAGMFLNGVSSKFRGLFSFKVPPSKQSTYAQKSNQLRRLILTRCKPGVLSIKFCGLLDKAVGFKDECHVT